MNEPQDVDTIFAELIKKTKNQQSDREDSKNYGEEYLSLLKSACRDFLKKERFEVGQIVKWKENLKNRKLPYNNQPAIVIAILDKPVVSSEEDSGSPYFLETLDIVLGLLSDDGTFLTFYYDSRRFEGVLDSNEILKLDI